ncbi:MAG: ArsR family transcriptional regulator [Rhizobiaceae bacterium]|nr:MAG: ArsR family transcriptional regulator [Rhizobiaceae bacterium]
MDASLVISALVEPRRREILRLVRTTPRSAAELREALDITQQAVSQHLQVLETAGLLRSDHAGRGRRYSLAPDGLDALDRFLAELWPDGLKRLKAAVEARRDS